MTTFLLIRHADTEFDGKAAAGLLRNVHLSIKGRTHAALLARSLAEWSIDAIYSSPLERACETAEHIAQSVARGIQTRQGLAELDYGDWAGEKFSQLARNPQWNSFNSLRSWTRIPGGELILEAQMRIVREIELLRAEHPYQTVAVVTHADVLRVFVGYCLGIPIDLLLRIEFAPASLSVVTLDDNGPRVVTLNDTSALREQPEPEEYVATARTEQKP